MEMNVLNKMIRLVSLYNQIMHLSGDIKGVKEQNECAFMKFS